MDEIRRKRIHGWNKRDERLLNLSMHIAPNDVLANGVAGVLQLGGVR